jgi:iron(III) transport system permease protein
MKAGKWILFLAGAIFIAIAVLPVGLMFFDSVKTPEGFSLGNYSGLLTERRQRELLTNSLLLALSSATLATLLGAPSGFFLARTRLSSRSWWRMALIVPLLVPPYILGVAWIFARDSLIWLGGGAASEWISAWTYSLPGAIVILSLSYYPIPMLITEASLNRVEARLEEAAWLIAGWRRTLVSITLPLVLPAVAAGFLLVFVLVLAEFSVPMLLRVRVFSTEVYTQFAAFFNFGAATAAATPLLLLILVFAVLIRILLGEKLIATRRGLNANPLFAPQRWVHFGQCFLSAVLIFGLLLPLVSLAVKIDTPPAILHAMQNSSREIVSSLSLSGATAAVSAGLGLLLGYWRARTQARWRALADVLWILLFTLPGTVLGIGMVQLWNRPGLAPVYGTWAVLLLGLVARFAPVSALLLAAGVRQIAPSLEEAAVVHGSQWWRTFTKIVLPNAKSGLLAVGFLVFALVFGELAITLLLIPSGSSTLPLQIFTTITNSPDHVMAALCLLQVLVILIPLFVLSYAIRRLNRRHYPRWIDPKFS